MAENLKFLIVDDDAQKRFLIVRELAKEFPNVQLVECESGEEAITHLQGNPVHGLITDNSMSPINGVELITWVRARFEIAGRHDHGKS